VIWNIKRGFLQWKDTSVVYNHILNKGLVDTSDTIANRVKEYIDAGVYQFFLAYQDPFDSNALELFITSVKWD
jgi:hypothetical protein